MGGLSRGLLFYRRSRPSASGLDPEAVHAAAEAGKEYFPLMFSVSMVGWSIRLMRQQMDQKQRLSSWVTKKPYVVLDRQKGNWRLQEH